MVKIKKWIKISLHLGLETKSTIVPEYETIVPEIYYGFMTAFHCSHMKSSEGVHISVVSTFQPHSKSMIQCQSTDSVAKEIY